ncbi:YHS domain-containing (seleno)protein [Roseofilum reptotaenium CS-1145]|uniref:YHS domain-containing protein n=1 Tax=Roseofilum reptotaenium AO1-A TaxID=1925591 RepID=A0A1L9QX29_9CYAN|nr:MULTISPECIES: YHS domain-containing (seleno)protein [Roseofilum]MBP0027208.1 YHS domain-containing protein [Roseofilum sp. Guam]MDB9519306.1 YHS domain-containing (seleno)protein [Roseofilum reptotaenium CS-1145]OJJ27199.1 YHS domain-containing protein [Roseofilum reptotaenium AO1-A]
MFPKYLLMATLSLPVLVFVGCTSNSNQHQTENQTISVTESPSDRQEDFSLNLDEQGRALKGYDPVTYFTEGKPVQGKAEFSLDWNGATWYFSSAEHRERFAANPDQFAPANGGYCTFGVVLAKKFDGDPKVWSLHENRLYVFLNEEVKTKFFQDTVGNFKKVSKNWPEIAPKAPEEL